MKLHVLLTLSTLALLGTTLGRSQSQPYNGFWWESSSENYRLGFVSGYATAMTNSYDRESLKCIADKNGGVIPQKYPGDEALKACLQSSTVVPLDFTHIPLGQLADGVDQFYGDFRNKGIDINLALSYVRDEIKGKPAKELEDELVLWRQGHTKRAKR